MDPRMYPLGHSAYDASQVGTPATTDIMGFIRGTATAVFATISSFLAVVRSNFFSARTITADGAITAADNFVILNSTTPALAVTIAAPTVGQPLIITQGDAGTAGHTVTLTAGTFDGNNEIMTFNAAGDTLVLFGVSTTRYVIVENIGSVAPSTAGG